MNILLCVDRLTGGGAQRVASLWVTGWIEKGYDVSIVLSNTRTPRTYPVPKNVTFYDIDWKINNDYFRYLLKKLFNKHRIKSIIEKSNPDVVVVVDSFWTPLIYNAKKNNNFSFKLIATEHNSFERPETAPMSKREAFLKFEFNKKIDQVTVLTQADKDFIGSRLSNVDVLPNPLAFLPLKEIHEKKNVLLAMGRLDSGFTKGFDVLIKAFGMTTIKGWTLQVVGDGSLNNLNKYKKLAKECGVEDRVEFIGFTDNPIKYFKDASIFVLSSRYEGFGMVLIEAMSQGCACIACDYKGRQREIITNETEGLICQPDDPKSLALCMDKMMSDNEYRTLVQQQSPKRASFYSLDNIMKSWDLIFQKHNLL